MSFTISIEGISDKFECDAEQNVLAAMEKLGRRGIPVGCRGGGCGVCRVLVVGYDQADTKYRTLKMSKAQVSEDDVDAGIALACKLIPEGDLSLRLLGSLKKWGSAAERFWQDEQTSDTT